MDEALIQGLQQRDAEIIARQQALVSLLLEYDLLQQERQEIDTLLRRYGVRVEPARVLQSLRPMRHTPGEVDIDLMTIMCLGTSYGITELVHVIEAQLGKHYADSTIGVALRRGVKTNQYQRQGKRWIRMPLLQEEKPDHVT
jgi:hypothetical protein